MQLAPAVNRIARKDLKPERRPLIHINKVMGAQSCPQPAQHHVIINSRSFASLIQVVIDKARRRGRMIDAPLRLRCSHKKLLLSDFAPNEEQGRK